MFVSLVVALDFRNVIVLLNHSFLAIHNVDARSKCLEALCIFHQLASVDCVNVVALHLCRSNGSHCIFEGNNKPKSVIRSQ